MVYEDARTGTGRYRALSHAPPAPCRSGLAEQTGLHQRAIAGIGAFLQNEEYAPNISRTIYENDRYRVEGPGFLFRVNATLGEVVTDDLVREEAVSAFNQSDDYHRVREAISNTT